jgi:predicted RND superfamily exporter protein
MGWFDIPLNMFTAMVPSVAIGIAVDDTIHLMWRIRKEMKVHKSYREAIIRSLQSVGKPIVTTTILLCVGFSVFYFSGLTLLTQFGLLTLLTVFNALITDLFLMPALLLAFKPFGPTDHEFSPEGL